MEQARPTAPEQQAPAPPPTSPTWLAWGIATYCVAALLDSCVFALDRHGLTPLHLGAGVVMVLCLRAGWKVLPFMVAVSLALKLSLGMQSHAGDPFVCALTTVSADALTGALAAMLLRRVFRTPPVSVPDMFRAVALVCLPAAMSGAALTALMWYVDGIAPPFVSLHLFAMLSIGGCTGLLLVYPTYRAWTTIAPPTRREVRWIAAALAGNLVFLVLAHNGLGGSINFIILPLVLLAHQARLNGVMLALLTSMLAVAFSAVQDVGPFQMPTTEETGFLLATYLCSSTLVTLGVALHNRQLQDADSTRLMWQHKALCDTLTGLSNRAHFDVALDAAMLRAQRADDVVSLLMIDVDHFKSFNDLQGHVAGDRCLQAVAATLRGIVQRSHDVAARYGGEEFACVLPGTSTGGAAQLAESIRRAVAELAMAHPGNCEAGCVTVSIGVATMRGSDAILPQNLVNMADHALYRAKAEGRNRVAVSVPRHAELLDEAGDACGLKLPGELVRFTWRADYECGNARIDTQHRQLFELANTLLAAFLDNAPRADCLDIIRQLLTALDTHFRDEETLLRSLGYPDADHHADQHNSLLQTAADLAQRYEGETLPLSAALDTIANAVVVRHMLRDDVLFHQHVRQGAGHAETSRPM